MASDDPVPIVGKGTEVNETGNDTSRVINQEGEIDLKVGRVVLGAEAAYDLYNVFALSNGFGIRKGKVRYKAGTGVLCERFFYCSKEGSKLDNEPNGKIEKLDTRTGCKAHAKFKIEDGVWERVCLENEHNHDLAPPEHRHLLKSDRHIPNTSKYVIRSMAAAGIRPMKAYRYLSKEAGGVRNVGFTNVDHFNLLNKEKSESLGAGDAQSLIDYFKLKQAKNPMFFYPVELDDDQRLKNFFWRDGQSKIDYECFGDVVIFDTTYRTNKYNMMCAPFVGVNHHWKNTFFGCAFLRDEKKSTFVWLLKAFKSAMRKAPKTIFTDQDHAMKSAIKETFPETQHHLCIWHILKNAGSNISHLYSQLEFKEQFNKLFYACESIFEFETVWKNLVKDYGVDKEKWLKKLYDIRENWCSCFSLETFSAGIKTTQRSESTNNVFQKITCATMTLTQFVKHYEQRVEEMRDDENSLDFSSDQGRPYMRVRCGIIEHAAEVYTHRVFYRFQLEFFKSVDEQVTEIHNDGTLSSYFISKNGRHGEHRVEFNASNSAIHCSCKMFESKGWLCSHALRVLNVKIGVQKIPEQYIIQRWKKNAKNSIMMESFEPSIEYKETSKVIRLNKLMRKAFFIMNIASENETKETIASESLDSLLSELGIYKDNHDINGSQPDHGVDYVVEESTSFHSPDQEQVFDPHVREQKAIKTAESKAHWKGNQVKKEKVRKEKMILSVYLCL